MLRNARDTVDCDAPAIYAISNEVALSFIWMLCYSSGFTTTAGTGINNTGTYLFDTLIIVGFAGGFNFVLPLTKPPGVVIKGANCETLLYPLICVTSYR